MALVAHWFISGCRHDRLKHKPTPPNALLAILSAERLERLTGDHCEVEKVGGVYRIVRIDVGGKVVEQSSS